MDVHGALNVRPINTAQNWQASGDSVLFHRGIPYPSVARRDDIVRDRGADLDEFEEAIEHLKVAYDRYFNGVDNMPPVRKHEAVTRLMREFMRRPPMRTVQRFRYQTLKGRLNTYEQYWNRIMRQIEQGTYKRLLSEARRREEVMRARRAEHRRSEAKKAASSEDAPRTRARGTTEPVLPPGMSSADARALYKNYVQAKRAAGESTDGLTYGTLVRKLSKAAPNLQKKHGGDVRFEVGTSNGKVTLRAKRAKTR